jgi:hypothetical protein
VRAALVDGAHFFDTRLFEYLLHADANDEREMVLNPGLPETGVRWVVERFERHMETLSTMTETLHLEADAVARLLQSGRIGFTPDVTRALTQFFAHCEPRRWSSLHTVVADLPSAPALLVDVIAPVAYTFTGTLHYQPPLLDHPNGGGRLWSRFWSAYETSGDALARGDGAVEAALMRHAPPESAAPCWLAIFRRTPERALSLLAARPLTGPLPLTVEQLEPFLHSPDAATRLGAVLALQSVPWTEPTASEHGTQGATVKPDGAPDPIAVVRRPR